MKFRNWLIALFAVLLPVLAQAQGTPPGILQSNQLGAANGVAPLDGTAKVPTANLPSVTAQGGLAAANNLSDVANTSTARGSLGLGALAVLGSGTGLTASGGNLNLQAATSSTLGGISASATSGLSLSSGALSVNVGTSANQILGASLLGAANGVASLDGSMKLLIGNLPTGTSSSTVALGTALQPATVNPGIVYSTGTSFSAANYANITAALGTNGTVINTNLGGGQSAVGGINAGANAIGSGITALGFSSCGGQGPGMTSSSPESTCIGWLSAANNVTGTFITTLGLNSLGLSPSSVGISCVGTDCMRNSYGNGNAGLGDSCMRDGTFFQSVCVGSGALPGNATVSAVVTASLGTTGILTVTAVTSGTIAPNNVIVPNTTNKLNAGLTVSAYGTNGTNGTGGTGTYQTSYSGTALPSQSFSFSPVNVSFVSALGSFSMSSSNITTASDSYAMGNASCRSITSASGLFCFGKLAAASQTTNGGMYLGNYAGLNATGPNNIVVQGGNSNLSSGGYNILMNSDMPTGQGANYFWLNLGNGLMGSMSAPSISSGFGTSPSVVSGSSFAFTLNVGTGGTASSGVINPGTAPNGWVCNAVDSTHPGSSDVRAVPTSTTAATITNYARGSSSTTPWAANDVLAVGCLAF